MGITFGKRRTQLETWLRDGIQLQHPDKVCAQRCVGPGPVCSLVRKQSERLQRTDSVDQ
jgi:hypothetical protein